jgi:O-antigen ligase
VIKARNEPASTLRWQLEGALQAAVFGLVCALALASSNIDLVNIPIARLARWALLAILLAFALTYALLRRRPAQSAAPEWIAAVALGVFALASTAWSPVPGTTLGRSLSFVALLGAAVALAAACRGDARAVGQLLLAVLAASVTVAIGGLLLLWDAPERALLDATIGSPTRYNGIGGNPNTMAMLMAFAMPLALWALLEARTRAGKLALVACFVLLDGAIVASGSRGALAGAGAGLLVVALVLARGRQAKAVAALAVLALVVVDFGIMQLPPNGTRDPARLVPFGQLGQRVPLGPRDADFLLPLESEIGFPQPGDPRVKRGFFETSGRTVAWRGALEQAAERPALGFGFGTEEVAFVDRYYLLLSSRPENSYVSAALELGAVGTAILLVLLGVVVARGRRAVVATEPTRRVAAACAGVTVCGLVIAVTQSYLTAAGSVIAAPFWLCTFLLAALVPAQATARRAAILEASQITPSTAKASARPRTGIAKRAST